MVLSVTGNSVALYVLTLGRSVIQIIKLLKNSKQTLSCSMTFNKKVSASEYLMFYTETLLASDGAGRCFSTSLWRTSSWPSSPSQVCQLGNEWSSLEGVFSSLRPDDLGDHGLLGGRLGALQALQVPPDLLHHLLQLHDPRTLRGAAQVRVICLVFSYLTSDFCSQSCD